MNKARYCIRWLDSQNSSLWLKRNKTFGGVRISGNLSWSTKYYKNFGSAFKACSYWFKVFDSGGLRHLGSNKVAVIRVVDNSDGTVTETKVWGI